MAKKLASFDGNITGPNVGDSKIYATDEEILLFEAKQISFDLHHKIDKAIRMAEASAAKLTRNKIIREIRKDGKW